MKLANFLRASTSQLIKAYQVIRIKKDYKSRALESQFL